MKKPVETKAHTARESRATYATNTITLPIDLLARIDAACYQFAITREEFLRDVVNARLPVVQRVDKMPSPLLQTREEIHAEWASKKPLVEAALQASAGAWTSRSDMGDTARWVRKLGRESS